VENRKLKIAQTIQGRKPLPQMFHPRCLHIIKHIPTLVNPVFTEISVFLSKSPEN